MDADELKFILMDHEQWLADNNTGKRADLTDADLDCADLAGADLRHADLIRADLKHANLAGADLAGADLAGANLRYATLAGADLRYANLNSADLTRADLDFSSFPLWCGSFKVKVDKRIAAQLAYHFCRLDCDNEKYLKAKEALTDLANDFHRVEECGKI
jgi:uncharacterized protein YjbI with pentapeptide repeats